MEALARRAQMSGALLLREAKTQSGRSRIGYLWALIEPLSHVAVMCVVYWAINRRAPVGPSVVLFFITGVLPFFLFHKVALQVGGAVRGSQKVLRMPFVSPLDMIVARAVLAGLTWVVVISILVVLLLAMEVMEPPVSPETAVLAALLTFALGLGVGLVNATAMSLWSSWVHIYGVLTRPLYIFSGIFFSVDRIPSNLQYWLSWNPVLHAVQWFRTGFRSDYSTPVLDRTYLISWVLASLLLGLSMLRAARPRLAYT
ncbi:ABC transporter permease [Muricoccus aerilatus]|uniref:ABC transporter permease n=1 Tax=Muricoccus aerilatus TaxID=452982 RepID=UPI0005C1A650|nr:ABC transporter permease [Roseomonas aerilata]